MKNLLFISAFFFAVFSCTQEKNNSSTQSDAYTMMETAFEGSPSKSEIKPLMEKVLNMYGFTDSEENLQKVGSVLVSLRKESVLGVTEIEILKHIYQHGNENITFQEQAAFSAVYLEKYSK